MGSPNTLALVKAANSPQRPEDEYNSARGFSPMVPSVPMPVDDGTAPRSWEYLPGFNLPTRPGTGKLVPFDLLRTASLICTPLRRAIEIRKQEISTQDWDIVVKEEYAKKVSADDVRDVRQALLRFFKRPDPDEGLEYGDWIRLAEEYTCVYDAFSVYLEPTLGPKAGILKSGLHALNLVDGSTIKPIINIRGRRPRPPAVAFQQYLYGAPRTDFQGPEPTEDDDGNPIVSRMTASELYYRPFTRTVGSIYGFGNVETALPVIRLWLGRIKNHQNYFDESSIPAAFMTAPPNWQPQQIDDFERMLNRMLAADPAWRQRIKVAPNGSHLEQLKPPQYDMTFDEWLIRMLAMCADVTAEELGLSPKSGLGGKGFAEAAGQRQIRVALQPRLTFYAAFFNFIIQYRLGVEELEFKYLDVEEKNPLEESQADNTYVNAGIRSRNEVREEKGWDKSPEPIADMLTVTTKDGVVTLKDAQHISDRLGDPPEPPPPTATPPGSAPEAWQGEEPAAGPGEAPASGGSIAPNADDKNSASKAAQSTALTKKVYAYLAETYPADVLKWVNEAGWGRADVPLADIDMARRPGGRDDAKTAAIQRAIEDGKQLDPVVLVKRSDGSHAIADGYHRTKAYERSGAEAVDAYVGTGVGDEGPWDKAMHDAKLNKAVLEELRQWERFEGRPRSRGFMTKAIAPDLTTTIRELLAADHEGLDEAEYRRVVFDEARAVLTKNTDSGFFTDDDGVVHPIRAIVGGGGGGGGKSSGPSWHGKQYNKMNAEEKGQFFQASGQGKTKAGVDKDGNKVLLHTEHEPPKGITAKEKIATGKKTEAAKEETKAVDKPSWSGKPISQLTSDEKEAASIAAATGKAYFEDGKWVNDPVGGKAYFEDGKWVNGPVGGKAHFEDGKWVSGPAGGTGGNKDEGAKPVLGSSPNDSAQAAETKDAAAALDESGEYADTQAGQSVAKGATYDDRQPAASAAAWEAGLDPDQESAVSSWTDGGYAAMRDAAQGKSTIGLATLQDFNAVLKTAPAYNGPVYRGVKNLGDTAFKNITGTSELRMAAPASFSKDKSVGLNFGTGGQVGSHSVTFQVEAGHGGADISSLSHFGEEKEVVMPQGHSFTVSHVEVHDRTSDQGGQYAIMHLVPNGTGSGAPHL